MACALTGSQAVDCKDSIGGIKELKVKAHPGLQTIETDFTISSGSVTAIATGSQSLWYLYTFEKETASVKDDPQPNQPNGTLFYQQEVKLIMNKLSARLSYEVDLLAKNRLLVAVRDMNDNYFIVGLRYGADLTAATAGTGTARGDRSGYELTFTAKEDLPIQYITKAIYDTLDS